MQVLYSGSENGLYISTYLHSLLVSMYATLSMGVFKKSEIVEATVELITEAIFEMMPLFPQFNDSSIFQT